MIVVPALHPAHDIVVRVDALSLGTVRRVASDGVFAGVGGKALNVALAIAALDVPVRLIVLGDAALLAGLQAHADRHPALDVIPFPSPVPTRTDIALVEADGRLTVINATAADPGTALPQAFVGASLDGVAANDVVVLAGSTPDRTGDVHPALGHAATTRGARVVVDASGPALTRLLGTRPEAVKVSAAEAAEAAEHLPTTLEAIPIVGITDGGEGLRAWLPDGRAVRVLPPHGLQVVASLGAGDAVTAGLAIALARGDDPLEGFVLGTAMAASTLDHLSPSVDAAAVADLRQRVRVIPLDGASTDVTT